MTNIQSKLPNLQNVEMENNNSENLLTAHYMSGIVLEALDVLIHQSSQRLSKVGTDIVLFLG